MSAPGPTTAGVRPVRVGGCLDVVHRVDADGVHRLRSTEALLPFPARLTDRLEHWAQHAPDRVQVAQRAVDGRWIEISYARMLERVRRIGQALALRGLSAQQPIVILSDNDLEHYTLALAAQCPNPTNRTFAEVGLLLSHLFRGQFAAASGDIRALLLAVVTSDAFRFRRGT